MSTSLGRFKKSPIFKSPIRASSIPATPATRAESTRDFLLQPQSDRTGIEPTSDLKRSPYHLCSARRPSRTAAEISALGLQADAEMGLVRSQLSAKIPTPPVVALVHPAKAPAIFGETVTGNACTTIQVAG